MAVNDFPLENLPFGVFRRDGEAHICTAIGDRILDLHEATRAGLLDEPTLLAPALNAFMATRRTIDVKTRIRAGNFEEHMLPMDGAEMLLPVNIGDYTDFYASVHHATNV
ncbi:MAG TPA: fumarylacetoacetase, partial [Thermoanaerobaculia bacterium]